eukprot:GHUV01017834.1.p1 GENE.GHUV01017834.1~~GHUV01017834.1.p1  ORF type:complete len:309 (-),score=45.96 GHUV01017834.1:61-987(-)
MCCDTIQLHTARGYFCTADIVWLQTAAGSVELPRNDRSDPQLDALLRIKASIDKTNVLQEWGRDTGQQAVYCAWRCVDCVAGDTVTGINIWGVTVDEKTHWQYVIFGCVGTLPDAGAFTGLDSLEAITISYQRGIAGTIPDWSTLTNVNDIQLARNGLYGSIPGSLGRLTRLRRLYAYENRSTGSIPEGLQTLTALEELWLFTNLINGTIPHWLGKLTQLKLNLGANKLQGSIPADLQRLAALTELRLDNNLLTGTIPSWLGYLTSPPMGCSSCIWPGTNFQGLCLHHWQTLKSLSGLSLSVNHNLAG